MSDGTPDFQPRQGGRPRRNPVLSRRIGTNIRRARNAKGLTQTQLARLIDDWTDGTAVSRWERGIVRPLDRTLERLAEVLEVDEESFYVAHEEAA